MTWFEEWFLLFEWSYGHTNVRGQDLEHEWEMNNYRLDDVKSYKLALEAAIFQS